MHFFSLALIVASNLVYQISQKSIPHAVHPLVATAMAYCVALLLSVALLIVIPLNASIVAEVQKLNWTSYALGVSIVGVELGFLLAYRAGWDVSVGAVLANSVLMILLVPLGVYVFREELSWTKILGIILCIVGVIMIARK